MRKNSVTWIIFSAEILAVPPSYGVKAEAGCQLLVHTQSSKSTWIMALAKSVRQIILLINTTLKFIVSIAILTGPVLIAKNFYERQIGEKRKIEGRRSFEVLSWLIIKSKPIRKNIKVPRYSIEKGRSSNYTGAVWWTTARCMFSGFSILLCSNLAENFSISRRRVLTVVPYLLHRCVLCVMFYFCGWLHYVQMLLIYAVLFSKTAQLLRDNFSFHTLCQNQQVDYITVGGSSVSILGSGDIQRNWPDVSHWAISIVQSCAHVIMLLFCLWVLRE